MNKTTTEKIWTWTAQIKQFINLHMDCLVDYQNDSGQMVLLGNWLEYVVLVRRAVFVVPLVQSECTKKEFGREFDWMRLVAQVQMPYELGISVDLAIASI